MKFIRFLIALMVCNIAFGQDAPKGRDNNAPTSSSNSSVTNPPNENPSGSGTSGSNGTTGEGSSNSSSTSGASGSGWYAAPDSSGESTVGVANENADPSHDINLSENVKNLLRRMDALERRLNRMEQKRKKH